MAPRNQYLDDPANRQRIYDHDPLLLSASSPKNVGVQPGPDGLPVGQVEWHWDFNQQRECDRILDECQVVDGGGVLSLVDLTTAIYGESNDVLLVRVGRALLPEGKANIQSLVNAGNNGIGGANAKLYLVDDAGMVRLGDRFSAARNYATQKAEWRGRLTESSIQRAATGLIQDEKKAAKISPAWVATGESKQIQAGVWDGVKRQLPQLGNGSEQ